MLLQGFDPGAVVGLNVGVVRILPGEVLMLGFGMVKPFRGASWVAIGPGSLCSEAGVDPLFEERDAIGSPWRIRRHFSGGDRAVDRLRVGGNRHPGGIVEVDAGGFHAADVAVAEERADVVGKGEWHHFSFGCRRAKIGDAILKQIP